MPNLNRVILINSTKLKYFNTYLVDQEKNSNTSEFTDKFKTKDVLGLGFGLFDDGVDLEKKYLNRIKIIKKDVLKIPYQFYTGKKFLILGNPLLYNLLL